MSEWKRRRFWKSVAVTEGEGAFLVELDGRRVRTPAKALLALPTRALAEAVAAEWEAQQDEVDPRTMPFTRSANAAIDKVTPQFSEVADMVTAYGDSDLLCYRADHPKGLVERQAEQWDPVLEWAAAALGVRLAVYRGVMHCPQDPVALSRLSARVHALTPFQLTALHDLTSLTGSLILGFAAAEDWRDPQQIWSLSRLDEIWQQEQWGEDEEARIAAEAKREAFMHAKRFLAAASASGRD